VSAEGAGEDDRDPDGRSRELEALDASIARGLGDADAGRTRPATELFDRLEAKYREQADAPRRSSVSRPRPSAIWRPWPTGSPATTPPAR